MLLLRAVLRPPVRHRLAAASRRRWLTMQNDLCLGAAPRDITSLTATIMRHAPTASVLRWLAAEQLLATSDPHYQPMWVYPGDVPPRIHAHIAKVHQRIDVQRRRGRDHAWILRGLRRQVTSAMKGPDLIFVLAAAAAAEARVPYVLGVPGRGVDGCIL